MPDTEHCLACRVWGEACGQHADPPETQDRPDYTLADVMASLEEMQGQLVAQNQILTAILERLKALKLQPGLLD